MGRHGESSLGRRQGRRVTAVLRIYCQVPEFAQPEARLVRYQATLLRVPPRPDHYNRDQMRTRPNHPPRPIAALLLLVSLAPAARALDAIQLEVREMTVAGIQLKGVSARLDLLSDDKTRVVLGAREALLPDPAGRFTNVSLTCDRPVVAEPRFGCDAGRFNASGGPTGSLDMKVTAILRSDSGVTTFSGKDLKVAGTSASFDGQLDARGWQVKAAT